jgi:hypothetical protein
MGILNPNQLQMGVTPNNAINQLFDAWKTFARASGQQAARTVPHPVHGGPVHLEACAVWETVSSIGLPRVQGVPLGPNPYRNVAVRLPRAVRFGFQALALGERRENFRPMAWQCTAHHIQTLKQSWFLGTHSSVGGGSRQPTNNIANTTLRWICAQLEADLGVGIHQQRLRGLTRLPEIVAQFGIQELESSQTSAAGTFRRTPGDPDPNQTVHVSTRLWDRYLTLTQNPEILDEMFEHGVPQQDMARGVYEWNTIPGRLLLDEDQPNGVEVRLGLARPPIEPPGPLINPGAPGGVAPHSGNRRLPFNTPQPPIDPNAPIR